MFVAAEGARITGTVHWSGGGTAAGARILIQDASGETLAEIAPAQDGSFSYQAREPMDHLVVANSGDGHRASQRISATELAAGFSAPALDDPQPHDHRVDALDPAATDVEQAEHHLAPPLDPAVEAAIGRALARQIIPLREELDADRHRRGLRDVLGGIGYIAGIAGLALWWRGRRSGGPG